MIPENIKVLFYNTIQKSIGSSPEIQKSSIVGGGDINQSVKIITTKGDYFLKWNKAGLYPGMFEKEAKGLNLLRNAGELKIPEVIGYDEDEDYTVLVLEYIKSSGKASGFWEDFSNSLSRLHNHNSDHFGLDHDNYIGSIPQSNKPHSDWKSFFIEERLERQIALALDNNRIDHSTIKNFRSMYRHLDDFFPVEKPSLLHGDLWSGNYMVSAEGKACIIDPAVYYGHRLMDLGMSKLFGGFSHKFYEAYNESHPLEKNWREAVEICNLYPLIVHVNLFGGGYLNSVKSVLTRFCQ